MSRRFGRNQKRKLREEVSALTADGTVLRADLDVVRRELTVALLRSANAERAGADMVLRNLPVVAEAVATIQHELVEAVEPLVRSAAKRILSNQQKPTFRVANVTTLTERYFTVSGEIPRTVYNVAVTDDPLGGRYSRA